MKLEQLPEYRQRTLTEEHKQGARAYYLEFLDNILTPLLQVENYLLNDEVANSLLKEDYDIIIKEALNNSKKIKFIKYPNLRINDQGQREAI